MMYKLKLITEGIVVITLKRDDALGTEHDIMGVDCG